MKIRRIVWRGVLSVLMILLLQPVTASSSTGQYEYLIVCPDSLEQIVLPYATSLSKIGIRTRIIPYLPGELEDMEAGKELIRREFSLYKIEYVTLIGSTEKNESTQYVIPMKQYTFEYKERELVCYSDMAYGTILDPEGALDLTVSRIPFETPEFILQYIDTMESFWKTAISSNKSVLLTGSWLWFQHCFTRECLLRLEDENLFEQPPFDTVNFHLREAVDKADLLEQIVPLYFPEEYAVYRLYEMEGLKLSNRLYFADDSLNEENVIKYFNETNPDIMMLSGALDQTIGNMKTMPALYRKIWKEDINQDRKPNNGEMGYPTYMTNTTVDRLKPASYPIVIADASFFLDPEIPSIGKTFMKQGAIGIIGNTGYGITTYAKNSGGFYENGPYSSIFLESLLLRSLQSGFPIGKAFQEMHNTNFRMHSATWTHYSMNLFGDPLIGFYQLPLSIQKSVVKTSPVDGEQNFEGKALQIQFNYSLVRTKKDLQTVKERIILTDVYTNLAYTYTPSWDQDSRILTMETTNPLPPDTWFTLDIQGSYHVQFHTKSREEQRYFDLPATANILNAEFGSKDGIPNHIITITGKLHEMMVKGSTEIKISEEILAPVPSNKRWLYLSWLDTRNKEYHEQIPEGFILRITREDPINDTILNANLNTLIGKYYNNVNCLGKPVYEDKTKAVQYDWGVKKPNAFVNQDQFSVCWTGLYEFVTGYYRFTIQSDDGLVIQIDGEKIIDQWYDQTRREKVKRVKIEEGKHLIEIFYYDNTGPAGVEVKWERE